MAAHLYWVGAIPAMVFLAIFMMPYYYGSKARSVPEYLKLRFDEKTRGLNAISFAVMTMFSSGISMNMLSKIISPMVGVSYDTGLWISAIIVLIYIFLGGLTSAIYNEVLQFCLMVLGFLPMVLLGMWSVGGWPGLVEKLNVVAAQSHYAPGTWSTLWTPTASPEANPMGMEWFGMLFGVGFVLSFGYWCTDFLVVQRAMSAESMSAARRTPLIGAFPLMLFPALVVLPGLIAVGIHFAGGQDLLPKTPDGTELDYNMSIPALLGRFCPEGLLGLGVTALMASFMSGMAGNVTAFNTVWTYDIYQSYIARNQSDQHYLWVGRLTTIFGTIASIGTAYIASRYNSIMDLLQLVFGFVNAPLFATFMLGMFWKRTTGHAAFWGLISGITAAALHQGLTIPATAVDPASLDWLSFFVKGGWLCFGHPLHVYASDLALGFWTAIFSWTTCFTTTIVVSLLTKRTKSDEELRGLVYSLTPHAIREERLPWYSQPAYLAVAALAALVVFNLLFW